MNNELAPHIVLALGQACNPKNKAYKDARKSCGEGMTLKIDETVRIQGELTLGKDFEQTCSVRLSGLDTLAYLATIMVKEDGYTEKQALGLVQRVINQAFAEGRKPDQELAEKIKANYEKGKDRLQKVLPKERRSGLVRFSGETTPARPKGVISKVRGS